MYITNFEITALHSFLLSIHWCKPCKVPTHCDGVKQIFECFYVSWKMMITFEAPRATAAKDLLWDEIYLLQCRFGHSIRQCDLSWYPCWPSPTWRYVRFSFREQCSCTITLAQLFQEVGIYDMPIHFIYPHIHTAFSVTSVYSSALALELLILLIRVSFIHVVSRVWKWIMVVFVPYRSGCQSRSEDSACCSHHWWYQRAQHMWR